MILLACVYRGFGLGLWIKSSEPFTAVGYKKLLSLLVLSKVAAISFGNLCQSGSLLHIDFS